MLFGAALTAFAALLPVAFAQVEGNGSAQLSNGKYEISAEGIRANFITYGASISNLFINDTFGIERDIVLGFDNASYYSVDKLHPHLGGVPGRYANRIKNSSFSIDGTEYHVLPNENNNNDTLHGGPDGWDWRNWTLVAHTTDSITFSLVDPDGMEGFPGEVVAYVTYSVTPYEWHISMSAKSTTKITPIMLSSHTYWNLDGFQNPVTPSALNYSFYLPYTGLRTAIDNIEIPTGDFLNIAPDSPHDWYSAPKQLGAQILETTGSCGYNCTGYDNCYLTERSAGGPYDWRLKGPVATLGSPWSGIQLDIYTDQDAFQLYTCNNMNGTLAIKETQGFFNDSSRPRVVNQYDCLVMEVQDWIGGINYQEWGRNPKQLWGPTDPPYTLNAVYNFSVNKTLAATFNQTTY